MVSPRLKPLFASLHSILKNMVKTDMNNKEVFYETDHFILPSDVFQVCKEESDRIGVDLDYFLFEFCDTSGFSTTSSP